RCVADLIAKESDKKTIILTTESGNLKSEILGDKLVSTEIGIGKTKWNEIPISENLDTKNLNIKIYDLDNKEHFGGIAVNVGNPHVIFFVENNENFDIKKIGPEIECHKLFPERCNVTLATIINKELIKVKVWERGAGLTKACGTAACATAFVAKQNGLASNKIDIEFSTGKLSISIDENNSIHMKGPVSDIKNIEIKI
ncbi:diaminopimelate epimerase, partial [Pelagibacterales bacterium SAG-MED46]|nr:diaminopimelate epimerase [Pelagibacterales bacterium SAG-MED46]